MRALLLALALLACGKVWIQHSFYQTAAEEALIAAYRTPAADACARVSPSAQPNAGIDWLREAEPHLEIGNPAVPVRLWQVDDDQWNARFRQAYLVLAPRLASVHTGLACSYDIMAGTAELRRS